MTICLIECSDRQHYSGTKADAFLFIYYLAFLKGGSGPFVLLLM